MAIRGTFSDGVSAKRTIVSLTLDAARLSVHSEATGELLASWPIETVAASSSYAVQTVLVSSVGGDAEIQLPTSEYAHGIRPHLRRHSWSEKFTHTKNRNFKLLVVSIFCLGSICLLLLGLRLTSPRLAKLVPFSTERRIFSGETLELPGVKACEPAPVIGALRQLAGELSTAQERREMPLDFKILDISLPNAFAFLGGKVYFTSGFLKQAESVDEVAGVLAHEMEHIYQRHVLTHLMDSYGFTLILGPLSHVGKFDPKSFATLLQLKYSRDDETSADSGAGKRLDAAGYSRQGMADFFHRLEAKEGKVGQIASVATFLSTHPNTTERVEFFVQGGKPAGKPVNSGRKRKLLDALKTNCPP